MSKLGLMYVFRMLHPIIRESTLFSGTHDVTNPAQFAQDLADFSTGSLSSQETPQSQTNWAGESP